MNYKSAIENYFAEKKIEYYSVLSYSDCRETNRAIIERESFVPRSVISFLVPYYAGATDNLSVYAASFDYHLILREITEGLGMALSMINPAVSYKGYGDHSPIDEVSAALSGGLGVLGDNGLLINEKYGSYVFIGDLVCDIPPEDIGAEPVREVKYCLHCGACRRACPTGILRGEGNDCLSAITQRKGELSESEIILMRQVDTVWGCDLCQSSCPYNKEPSLTPIEFFYKDRIPCLTSEILSSMDKTSFLLRAFAWRGRKVVERNLEVLGY